MNRRDCTDALWMATLAASKGPGQWYDDFESLRYSFFDKVASDIDVCGSFRLLESLNCHIRKDDPLYRTTPSHSGLLVVALPIAF